MYHWIMCLILHHQCQVIRNFANTEDSIKEIQGQKKEWEEGTHTQAEIEEYMATKEKKRLYARDYYFKKKGICFSSNTEQFGATPTTSKPEKNKTERIFAK
ncbi:uncharacterized protein LOC129924514 [Biomphalaria glabrata]|uniref:Uncharacterized protein LOC129924514 n=1 Tax=Biomphalaria glabrata TaxID=6526 RepID=A0A9W2ZKN5_BIOGL|nr:uncharacterized protein LOC129924514 [Biomphalaria glabrata]